MPLPYAKEDSGEQREKNEHAAVAATAPVKNVSANIIDDMHTSENESESVSCKHTGNE